MMKAVVISEPGTVEMRKLRIPRPAAGEVLIRVTHAGICSTDSMILNGVYSKDKLPLVPGHEFIGTIAGLGEGAEGWTVGDSVTADINLGCGTCRHCLSNRPLSCAQIEQLGIHRNGGFAEYVAVPSSKLIRLGGDASPEEYALVEPLSNVVRSVGRCGSFLGRSVAVVGDNFMTLLHLQLARLAGAWPVTLVSDASAVSSLGGEMGADEVLSAADAGAGSDEWDFVFETEGTAASYNLCQSLLAPGGRMLAFGIPPEGIMAAYEPFRTVLKEQSLVSAVAGSGTDMLDAVALIESGRLNLKPFTETVLPLEETGRGLDLMEMDKSIFKVLIEVNQ